jgi:hypothetical protein
MGYYFKFVIEKSLDINELYYSYILPFKIPKEKILLMPQCQTREEYQKLSPVVIDLCKVFGFRFSPRLQIEIYDKKTGV